MRPNSVLSIVAIAIIVICTIPSASVTATEKIISPDLDSLVLEMINNKSEDPIHNALLHIEIPGKQWSGAAGMADGISEVMTPNHKFKIASIGKTFTATVILQLVEEGKLKLENTLDEIFTSAEVNLDSLHVYEGESFGRVITVEQLLGQTSGLRDYMEDPRFFSDIMTDPTFQWSPQLIMQRYFDYGTNLKAAFPPGEGFLYADPNYVLLGMVIEKITGSTLSEQYRQRIFDPLKMSNSYLEFYEAAQGDNPLSHAYVSTYDISVDVNTSFDWAGGGIVSTGPELSRFFKHLLSGKLFREKATLDLMLNAANRGYGLPDIDYGYGIMKRQIHGLTFYGHGGAYDCDMFYCPSENISICTVLNQMNTHGFRDKFLLRAIELTKLLDP